MHPSSDAPRSGSRDEVQLAAGGLLESLRRAARALTTLPGSRARERAARARLAVAEERSRLAAELHDAIAHSVSGMIIQAAAAEAVMTRAPTEARRSLHQLQATGREAVAELRRMLGILRAAPGESPRPELDASRLLPANPRRRLRWSSRLDVLLALGCGAALEWHILSGTANGLPWWSSALLIAAATLPLAVRRRFPVAVMLTSTTAVAVHVILSGPEEDAASIALGIPLLIAAYSVGAYAPERRAVAAVAAAIVLAAVAEVIAWSEGLGFFLFLYFFWLGIAASIGFMVGSQRIVAGRSRQERAALARLAVVEERARLARELHDTVAHGVSVMVLQAGAAEHVLSSAPEQARLATIAVQDTGRSVLDELVRLLELLRAEGQHSLRTPQPSLSQLDALVTQVRGAGLPVELQINGTPGEVSAAVDAAAFRVIQEALTNALKHAARARTSVSVKYEPGAVALEVLSATTTGGSGRAGGGGHGLVGMRERVELYGGELHAGPVATGGYLVRARLPLESEGE